ncbi:hypothetical protein F2Q69_00028124 [Brassica cretica]|uniref:Uncharacterized protein n=1 Tax=Brassica cretica TaxID=69181 RepID=A0A8S9S5S2_BRACR|nr:hypothetical protein F2Q69_00028124 [Brassica cretica]
MHEDMSSASSYINDCNFTPSAMETHDMKSEMDTILLEISSSRKSVTSNVTGYYKGYNIKEARGSPKRRS